MPILLTTPEECNPGHGQPKEYYQIVMLSDFQVKITEREAIFVLDYGNAVDGQWVRGKLPGLRIVVRDKPAVMGSGLDPADGLFKVMEAEPADPAFTAMATSGLLAIKAADAGYPYLHCLGRDLYQFFIDQGHYQGTVIP